MPKTQTHTSTNRLLARLPRRSLLRVLKSCEAVELGFGEVIQESGARIRHVFFPTESFISLMLPLDRSSILEVAMVGDEGMVGLPLFSGVNVSPLRAVVQGAGPAWCIGATDFLVELECVDSLRSSLQRYMQVRLDQFARTAACTRFHVVEQRLARWLLMTQDRAHRAEFHVTHEFLAYMLGVRRVGVTRAAGQLQAHKLIAYHRGHIEILDRAGLEAASCSCYEADRLTYKRVMAGAS